MEYLKIKTKGNASPQGKPRVFFTCHPDDFQKYFEPITKDLFEAADCAVYYTEDMDAQIPEEYKETDLGRINLFVIPVSLKLLIKPNRAMDSDYAFAREHHIPVLTLMMEPSLDDIYSRPDKFGQLQYLNPGEKDTTAIPYMDKLKKYLSSILIDSETAERVRAAFDAYIFLSYRKKDRAYANELMKLIHRNPVCRDIAIWYDEFLNPGESFSASIERALEKSELFTLMITPNLINEDNYVINTEYPLARERGKKVLPVEVVQTDQNTLNERFKDLPEITDTKNEEAFQNRLLKALERTAKSENDMDPAHNFLIGLAYMEGIDVEVDRARGAELIKSAGETGLEEAIIYLYEMYSEGHGVPLNYKEAIRWSKKLIELYQRTKGEDSPEMLGALHRLTLVTELAGDSNEALEIEEKVYEGYLRLYGEEHPETLTSLTTLALAYKEAGNSQKALELRQKLYNLSIKLFGEDSMAVADSLADLSHSYLSLHEPEKALEAAQKAYELRCKRLGEEHRDTIFVLGYISDAYDFMGEYDKALEIGKKAYELMKNAFGEEHPVTAISLANLGLVYENLGEKEKALEIEQQAYSSMSKVAGEEDSDSMSILFIVGRLALETNNPWKASEVLQKLYKQECKVWGEDHPSVLYTLSYLSNAYFWMDEFEKSKEVQEKIYLLSCKKYGKTSPDALSALTTLASATFSVNKEEGLKLMEKAYASCCEVLGEEHPTTKETLETLETFRYLME